jgi:hypothetical protein
LRRAFRQCYRPHPAVPTNRPTGLPSLLLARSRRQLHNSVLLPKPDLLYRGSTRELALDDIEALAAGAWILGTEGGDSPYLGVLNMRRLYAERNRVSLMSPLGPRRRDRTPDVEPACSPDLCEPAAGRGLCRRIGYRKNATAPLVRLAGRSAGSTNDRSVTPR